MQVQARDAAGQGHAAFVGIVSWAPGVVEEAAGGVGEVFGGASVWEPCLAAADAWTEEVWGGWWWEWCDVGYWTVWAEECDDVWGGAGTGDCGFLEGGCEGGWRGVVWTYWTAAGAGADAVDDDYDRDDDDAGNGAAAEGFIG